MGHQVTFHMLGEDVSEFFNFLSSRAHIVAARWTSDGPGVIVCENPAAERGSLAVWEERPDVQPQRKKVIRDDGSEAHVFDRQVPVLEFDAGWVVTHDGSPALLQGRLYSFLSEMDPSTRSLFQTARRWIKRSFKPCRFKLLGGYVGPAAMRWHREEGGILLPMFNPPSSPAWKKFIASQHEPPPLL